MNEIKLYDYQKDILNKFSDQELSIETNGVILTEEVMQELNRCKNDVVYFTENFCKINGNNIKLYDYQKEILKNYKH